MSNKLLAAGLLVLAFLMVVVIVQFQSTPSMEELSIRSRRQNNPAEAWWDHRFDDTSPLKLRNVKTAGKPDKPVAASKLPLKTKQQARCLSRDELRKLDRQNKQCRQSCSQDLTVTRETAVSFPISLVTGYYRMRSKNTMETYLSNMESFLLRLWTPTYVFTNNETFHINPFMELLQKRAKLMPGFTHVIQRDLEDTDMAREFGPSLKEQESRDPETDRGHNYWLYMVWLFKVEALMNAIELNSFCSEWFMWTDIGCFRYPDHKYQYWPAPERLNLVPKDRVLMSLVKPFQSYDNWLTVPDNRTQWLKKDWVDVIDGDHLAGTFIAMNTLTGVHHEFYHGLWYAYKQLQSVDHVIFKDQTAFNALYILLPNMFALVPSRHDGGPDYWVYLQSWLASREERPSTDAMSSLLLP